MQARFQARKRQQVILFHQQQEKSLNTYIWHRKLHGHAIDLIISNKSTLLDEIAIILRKYLHASWLVDTDDFKKLQTNFLIKPLTNLFEIHLKQALGDDIDVRDLDLIVRDIFQKFLDKEFVDHFCIRLIKASSQKIIEMSEEKSNPRKTHIFGILNQLYTDMIEGHDLINLSNADRNLSIKKRIPVLNKVMKYELTENNFADVCYGGYLSVNYRGILADSYLGLGYAFTAFFLSLTARTIAPELRAYLDSIAFLFVIAAVYNQFVLQHKEYVESSVNTTEKNIHQTLINQFIKHEILDDLLHQKDTNPEPITYTPKKIEKPVVASTEKGQSDNDYSYLSALNTKREKIRTKKIKIEEEINEITQDLLAPIKPNITISWNVEGKAYTYHSNNAFSYIVQLSSNDPYLQNYAQNNYVYFDGDLIWKLAGDKTKYVNLKIAFFDGLVVKSKNETGFTYRPGETTDEWTYKLKVVHKKGMGHLNLFFKPVAKVINVDENGKPIVSRLFMPCKSA